MNQTIQDFYQQASTRNFARDFQLRITSFIVNGINEIGEEDLVFLKTATLPGKTINVQSAPYMGLNFNVPGTTTFDNTNNWAVTFYCSQDYKLRELLELSMQNTFDQETSLGNMEPRPLVEYKIVLSLLDDKLNTIRTYELLGAFVTNVGAVNYNVTGNGAIQEITASIAYQYWVADTVGVNSGIGTIARGLKDFSSLTAGISNTVGRVGSIVSQIGGLFGGGRRR